MNEELTLKDIRELLDMVKSNNGIPSTVHLTEWQINIIRGELE